MGDVASTERPTEGEGCTQRPTEEEDWGWCQLVELNVGLAGLPHGKLHIVRALPQWLHHLVWKCGLIQCF